MVSRVQIFSSIKIDISLGLILEKGLSAYKNFYCIFFHVWFHLERLFGRNFKLSGILNQVLIRFPENYKNAIKLLAKSENDFKII